MGPLKQDAFVFPNSSRNGDGSEDDAMPDTDPEGETRPSDLPPDLVYWQPIPCGKVGYSLYDKTVDGITRHMLALQDTDAPLCDIMRTVRELDEHLVLASYMESTGMYRNSAVQPLYERISEYGGALTLDNLPDATHYLFYLKYWGKNMFSSRPDRVVWGTILNQALPNPGRARKIVENLTRYLTDPAFETKVGTLDATQAVRDFLLFVIPASLLGIYPDCQNRLEMRARMLVYTAFSICAPTCEELARFVKRNKWVVTYAIREYLFYALTHVPAVYDILSELYAWNDMHCEVTEMMDKVRDALGKGITSPSFLEDRVLWTDINESIYAHHSNCVKTCYRAASEPFYSRMLKDMHTAGAKKPANEPVATSDMILSTYTYVARFSVPPGRLLTYALTDVRAWGGLDSQATARIEEASNYYNMETYTADTAHALTWLREYDRHQYNKYYAFLKACHWRLSVSYGYLPIEWASKQIQALQRHYGSEDGLHEDAGVFLYCPQCSEIRCKPVTAPAGMDKKTALTAYYPTAVSMAVDGLETQLVCNAHNIRGYDKRIKHKARNKMNAGASLQDSDFRVAVCHNTPLIPICLIGVVVFTRNSGAITLCVNCGTAVKWTASSRRTTGPSCGCDHVSREDTYVHCALCDKNVRITTTRAHEILEGDDIRMRHFCLRHYTKWVRRQQTPFSMTMIRKHYKHRRKTLSTGETVFVADDPKKKPRRR